MQKDKKKLVVNKASIANEITNNFPVSRSKAADYVESILKEMISAIQQDGLLKLPGLGTFTVKNKKERQGRNPQDMKIYNIPARKSISYRCSKNLRKQLNDKLGETE